MAWTLLQLVGHMRLTDDPSTRARAVRAGCCLALLVVLGAPFFLGLGRWPLIEPDEGRNAEVAREMLAYGDWALPRFNALPFLDKPPALFWAIAGALRVVGVDEFAARLPSAASGVGLVVLGFAIARMLLDTRRAMLAAAILATSPLVLVFGRLVIFDMLFTALVTLALACLLRGRVGGSPVRWVPLAGLAMALATLTKGPVGIAVPLLAWVAARGALPPAERRPGWRVVLAAVVVFAAVVSPWLAAVASREPHFLSYAFVDETLLRFTSPARFNRGEPPWYPLMVLALGGGVWIAVLAALSPALVRRGRGSSREAVAIRFAARATAAILVFFTVSASKRPGYLLPALVPLSSHPAAGASAEPRRAAAALRVVGLASLAAGTFLAVAALARAGGWTPAVSLGEATPGITPAVLLVGGGVLFAWGLATALVPRARPLVTLALGTVVVPGLYLALLGPLAPYAEYRSARELARHIEPGADVIAFRTFRTSLPFYLRRPVVLASRTGRELSSNYVKSEWARFLDRGIAIRPRSVWRRLRDPTPAYVLVDRASGPLSGKDVALVAVSSDEHSLLFKSAGDVPRVIGSRGITPETLP